LYGLLGLGTEVEADYDPSECPEFFGYIPPHEEQSDYRPDGDEGEDALDYHAFSKQVPKGFHFATSFLVFWLFEPVNQNL
jgi:hypothetical protein